MRRFTIIGCIFAVQVSLGAGPFSLSETEVSRVRKLHSHVFERLPPNGLNHSRLQSLSDTDRELLIRFLRGRVEERRARGERESVIRGSGLDRDLALLGDDWGLSVFAEEFRDRPRGDWSHQFKDLRNAKLIPLVGDLLFKNEVYEEHGDLGFLPTQGTTAEGIIETLKYAPQFQPDVSQWGQELDRAIRKGSGGVLTILREWYRENEEKLRAGRFLEVRPGQTPQRTVGAESDSVPANAQEAAPARLKPEPMSVAAVPLKESESIFIESVAVAALALLAGLLFFWNRRKTKGL